jgi:hypothetical protein
MGRGSEPALGILRGYPRPLSEQAELRPCLCDGETGPTGSALLARSLLTLPTHSLLSPRDVAGIRGWIEAGGRGYGEVEAPARAVSGDQPRRLSGWLS